MKISFALIVGAIGFCLIQGGCGGATPGNNKPATANREVASANVSASANQIVAQNSNATNSVPAGQEVKPVPGTENKTQSSSGKFGQNAVVELPDMKSKVGSSIVVPVKVNGLAKKDVISFEFDLKYDPAVIQPLGDGADIQGSVSQALSLVTNKSKPGLLRVVAYGAMAIEKDGVLLNLKFTAVGAAGAVSPISFERIMFNEGDPGASATSGQVTLIK